MDGRDVPLNNSADQADNSLQIERCVPEQGGLRYQEFPVQLDHVGHHRRGDWHFVCDVLHFRVEARLLRD